MRRPHLPLVFSTITFLTLPLHALGQTPATRLLITAHEGDGRYSIAVAGSPVPVLQAGAAVKINGTWLRAADYPKHTVSKSISTGELGPAEDWTIIYSGLKRVPDLLVNLRAYQNQPFGELQVTVRNTTGKSIKVDGIRSVDGDAGALNLGGSHAEERVLSDSFSEDRPGMKIHDFTDAEDGMHRAVGSQIVYNLTNHRSWFIGTLTSDKFLTVLRLHVSPKDPQKLDSYEVESTGTTELLNENSLKTRSRRTM